MYCDGCGCRLDIFCFGYEVSFHYGEDIEEDTLNLCEECKNIELVSADNDGLEVTIKAIRDLDY